ncbi:MAG: formate--tetrahydrofolate ligase [Chloroflexota bacterium]|nr:MAG: formate--tetrahydrofolate ligase [Chloroflexota bacterium]
MSNFESPLPIARVAEQMGLGLDDIEPHGKYRAKMSPDLLTRFSDRPNGKYIVVTSITPTPPGEGKTTTAIGLAMGMNRMGYRAAVSLRQSSLGAVLNYRGGSAGGGSARLEPYALMNLNASSDHHVIALANNLLASCIDNVLVHGNPLELDPFSLAWSRVIQISDRALRQVLTGLGGRENGTPREARFDAVTASEVMALIGLVNGADEQTTWRDLRARVGRIVIGRSRRGKWMTADDLGCAGAMTALLQEALKPNLVQTNEGTPAFVHTGTLGHIAHGASSILADRIALRTNDYVITEAAFGSDLGLEKFIDIKCRVSGIMPNAIVLVATLRALKMHGGVGKVVAGKALPDDLHKENLHALERGASNLLKHIENAKMFGVPVIVAVNRFARDNDREIARVEQLAREAGAEGTYASDVYARGGAGAISLAEATVHAANKPAQAKLLYVNALPLRDKIERIATQIYGGGGIELSSSVEEKLTQLTEQGFGELPVCIAKTHLSLSHEEKHKGRPKNFKLPIRDVRLAAGAGYVIAFANEIRTMSGMPARPALEQIDIDAAGNIIGLE